MDYIIRQRTGNGLYNTSEDREMDYIIRQMTGKGIIIRKRTEKWIT